MNEHNDDVDGFWGDQRDWTDSHPRQRTQRTGRLSARLRTGMHAVLESGAAPTRSHGDSGPQPVVDVVPADDWDSSVGPSASSSDGLSIGELAMPWDPGIHEPTQQVARVSVAVAERPPEPAVDVAPTDGDIQVDDEAEWGPEWAPEVQQSRPRGSVDPLLAKLGVIVVALTLLIPLVLSLRGDSGDRVASGSAGASTLIPGERANQRDNKTKKVNARQSAGVAEGAGAATAADSTQASSGDTTASAQTSAQVTAAAEESCAVEYEVVKGDYWLRLVEGSGSSLTALLNANGATSSTPLHPGRTICLPAGSSTPPPPPAPSTAAAATSETSASGSTGSGSSTKPPTTQPPKTTSPPATSPPATSPPATSPPTTQAPPPPPPVSQGQAEKIIRRVWPDHLEDKAVAIAWRESNHRPEVRNYCCYGLFQIYWSVHQSWLPAMGITSSDQLFDAQTNARAAYALYQRAGGWGPWGG